MKGKPFVGANWKMNGSMQLIQEYQQALSKHTDLLTKVDIMIAPPYPYLIPAKSALYNVAIAAQTVNPNPKGAFTGEISLAMLVDVHISHVIVGHSERRHLFAESVEDCGLRGRRAVEAGLDVVFCVGESLEERKKGETTRVVEEQLRGLGDADWSRVVVAYEPVWAIGTGATATVDQVDQAHQTIKKLIGDHVKVIYGGSVTEDSAKLLSKLDCVDGFLVGGASLQPETFLKICSSFSESDQ